MIEAGGYRWAAPLLDQYNRRILTKSFASVRVAGLDTLRRIDTPVIAAPNHSCWWDGCVDIFLTRGVLRFENLLMMGERELSKHRVFSSIGIFSVPEDRDDPGRAASLRYAAKKLRAIDRPAILWVYPQGSMLPARAPITIDRGALLIARLAQRSIVPIAQRYEFLRDDHPDVLVRIGAPWRVSTDLESDQKRLVHDISSLRESIDRDIDSGSLEDYETVLSGTVSRNERLSRLRKKD